MTKFTKTIFCIILCALASSSFSKESLIVTRESPSEKEGVVALADSTKRQKVNFETVEVEKEKLDAQMNRLRMEEGVKSVEKNYEISTNPPMEPQDAFTPGLMTQAANNESPNDPQFSNQHAWKERTSLYKGQSNIENAFVKSEKNNQINVAIIDSGFRDTTDMVWDGGYNFSEVDDGIEQGPKFKYYDPDNCTTGHGQAVGQIIGATANDGYGMAGIADVGMYAIRALGCNNTGLLGDAAKSIYWAAGHTSVADHTIDVDIDVINLSLAGTTGSCPTYLQDAINYATEKDITVVAAAGNSSREASDVSPANCDGVITVGSVSREGAQSNFTNYGSTVDVSMLGESVLSAGTSSEFSYWTGTSFASPMVAGIVAMGKLFDSSFSFSEVIDDVKQSTNSFASTTEYIGTGILDAEYYYDLVVSKSDMSRVDVFNVLNSPNRCDDSLYINDDFIDTCSIHEVIVNDLEKNEGQHYVVFKASSKSGLEVSHAQKVTSSEFKQFILSEIEEGYQYGIQVCETSNGVDCKSEALIDLHVDKLKTPASCE